MPRSYGSTNAQQFASAPAVGIAGATYYNTTNSTLYVSNGTAWVALGAGGGAAEVNVSTGGPSPRAGELLWVDTDETPAAWPGPALVAYTERTDYVSGIQTSPIDVLSTVVTIPGGRRLEVSAEVQTEKAGADQTTWVNLLVIGFGGAYDFSRFAHGFAPGWVVMAASRIITPPAGTYTVRAQIATGAGFVNVRTEVRWLKIIDRGA